MAKIKMSELIKAVWNSAMAENCQDEETKIGFADLEALIDWRLEVLDEIGIPYLFFTADDTSKELPKHVFDQIKGTRVKFGMKVFYNGVWYFINGFTDFGEIIDDGFKNNYAVTLVPVDSIEVDVSLP